MEKILDTLIWAAVIQGLLLGLLYILSKKHSSLANKLLGLLLLAFVFEAFTILPFDNIGGYPTNTYFTLPEVKLFFPVLFLHYILEKLGRSKQYFRHLKIHYLLAIAIQVIPATNFLLFLFRGKSIFQFFDFGIIETVFMFMQYYAFFLSIISIIISIRETRKYTQLAQNTFSDLDMLKINWLWQFIFGIAPIIIVWGMELFRIAFGGKGPSTFVNIIWILIVIFIYFLSYKAFQQKNLLDNMSSQSQEDQPDNTQSYTNSEKDYEQLGKQLMTIMESDKLYLRHELTIYDVSKEMNISVRQISKCINSTFRKNFTEWINNFRVEEAIAKLKNSKYHHLSVEGIGFDSGFKSRSAMYAAFNKKTGKSPGQFRKE